MIDSPTDISLIDDANLNISQNTITKTPDELLQEVNAGNYDDFRRYLAQENIKDLDLSFGNAANVDLAHLGQALQGTQVHTLNLWNNNIGADDAAALVQALAGTQVHTLVLGYNNIGDDGAERVVKALQGTQVHTLELGCNNIGADGAQSVAKALQGTQVHTLNLGCNNIGADGAAALGQALKDTQVHTLDLSDNNIGADGAEGLGKALQGTQVHTLFLGLNKIGDDGAARLAACIPDTSLLKVYLGFDNEPLNQALETNRQKLKLTPYYLAHLALHLELKDKEAFWELPKSEATPTKELGIFMSIDKGIQSHILNQFPLMTRELKDRYQYIAQKAYDKEHPANADMIVENNNSNRNHVPD